MNGLAIDVGGTKISSAIFNSEGVILNRNELFIENSAGVEVGEKINTLIDIQTLFAKNKGFQLSSIGCCIPGIYWSDKKTVWAPNIPGWEDFPLEESIIGHIKNEAIKVSIDSDRACYILGEVWKGSAEGCKNAIFMAVGTGIGLGILINGEVLRGANDIAGATGWMALERPFNSKYVKCGCYEYSASGAGLARIAIEFLDSDNEYRGVLKTIPKDEITAKHIFDAFEKEDKIAEKVLKNAVELWGMAISNYISLFNPEKIVLGGGVFGPAVKFIPEIMEEAGKWAQPISYKLTELVHSKLGSDAGLYGAAYLALK